MMKGGKKTVDIEFFQVKECLGSSWPGQFQAWMLGIPQVCLLHCFPLCNENKTLKYPWDLEVAKMGISAVGDIDFFFPHWRRYVVCEMWERL